MATELKEVIWDTYSPLYALHVKGRYTPREYVDGKHEPQIVEAVCETCGQRYRAECRQGQPRAHVSRFARLHLHRHPLAPIPTR